MKTHGVIYQAPSRGKRFLYHALRSFGAGLVSFAIVGIIFSFWPILKEEFNYRFNKNEKITTGFGNLLTNAENVDQVKIEAATLGLDPYFSLYIPKIDAKAKVIPNVDAGNPKEYLWALSEGVAHARGTNFPGQGKTIYLFSHSTDSPLNFAQYNAVFYLLRKLEKGDTVTVYFLDKKYEYEVTDKLITEAGDTSWLDPASPRLRGLSEALILQTCDPPGTSLRRLIVVARLIDGN